MKATIAGSSATSTNERCHERNHLLSRPSLRLPRPRRDRLRGALLHGRSLRPPPPAGLGPDDRRHARLGADGGALGDHRRRLLRAGRSPDEPCRRRLRPALGGALYPPRLHLSLPPLRRAVSHLRWYREKFPDYPAERRALIPYLL
ncbi:MAG: hypothetical protein ACMG6S_03690 [Byssovorax sp.]